MSGGWTRLGYTPPRCDLCRRIARWSHPAGGYRCDECPRPEETPTQREIRLRVEAMKR